MSFVSKLFPEVHQDEPPIKPHYRRVDSLDVAKEASPPRGTTMLVRDFIDDSLYNPNYGYFSKQAVIFSPEQEFDFKVMKDNLEFMNILGKKYREVETDYNEIDDIARQVWHTPTELFKPWYGYAIAKYIVTEYKLNNYPHNDLIIYEMGAGNGTLMLNILDYIQKYEPSVYQRTQYKIIEISSKLAQRQAERQEVRDAQNVHDCVQIINRSIFDWDAPVTDPCFFIGLEVIDNFAHDLIRYDVVTGQPLQGVVVTNDEGEYEEVFEPVTDPLIQRYLALRKLTPYKSPALKKLLLRKLRNYLPFGLNLSSPEFIPTKALVLLESLKEHFPNHRLILGDFYSLPDSVEGVDAPVVQTRYQRTMVPCSTYMVQPGWFDIFFPTNFELLSDIYELVCRSDIPDSSVKVITQKEFLERYAEVEQTETLSGENPMLTYYENNKFLLT
ncbi:DUF185-domain-containing protein [Basidiobolus meristosporus CBS 931.73]|uniref:Protein arginine methyltransferase NDUFAF7 n=1 Tax=Basidiobolus meristosporus CBS 931.73 TaxID=1314790 RepID=A0A1Y1ZDQ4_9FUNG|nr:DUF185-domain-containing protein [Basidiobolus meristosporus CBS 931.73]|eukprot:ORY08422.1 DUF185-domain-containing protein [Basidiobolus meristosporus CBS 931.73]